MYILVFSRFFIYTYNMKKLFLILCVVIFACVGELAAQVEADDYVFQKQLIITDRNNYNKQHTCQTFRIHPNWFATAAHCVDMCKAEGACRIEILLAQGPVNVSVTIRARDIFVPKQYRSVGKEKQVTTHKNWDVALIRYRPEYIYKFPDGGMATQQEFNQALEQSDDLRVQWEGVVGGKDKYGNLTPPQIPVLYTYGGSDLMTLKQNLIVPRWNYGQMESFSSPRTVLYFGEKQALWGADGFGVNHGNSGGAVVLENGGVVGIATAKMDNQLPGEVRAAFPDFGQAYEFFLFNGFAPKTTLDFIKKTLARYGDRIRTEKLRRVTPMIDPTM